MSSLQADRIIDYVKTKTELSTFKHKQIAFCLPVSYTIKQMYQYSFDIDTEFFSHLRLSSRKVNDNTIRNKCK